MSDERARSSQEPNGSDWDQRKADLDCDGGYHCAAPKHVEGCLSADAEPAWGEGRGGYLADQLAEAMSPEMQAAALEGLADNPTAQTYAEGKASPDTRARLLAARDTALISGTDPGSLAFIVRDLMAAAGYEYDPERPLADQSRECCGLIRLTASEWHQTIAARANDSERHGAEEQRLTDLVHELRKHLDARDRVLEERTRELARVKELLATAQRTWLLAANRAAGRSDTDADGG